MVDEKLDFLLREISEGKRWFARLKEQNPEAVKNHCECGRYIGSNGIFIENCLCNGRTG
jgi:hypothetical protein